MTKELLFLCGAAALVFLILLGAAWLERPALGLSMGTVVACFALVLLFIGDRKSKPRGRSR